MKNNFVNLRKLCLAAIALLIIYLAGANFSWAEEKARVTARENQSQRVERGQSESQRSSGYWLDPVILSSSGTDAAWPAMAIDGNGTIHVAWHGDEEGNYEIYYMKRMASAGGSKGGRPGQDDEKGNWTKPLNISRTPGSSARPSIAAGIDGKVHVAWSEAQGRTREIYYVSDDGGAWSRALKISSSQGESTNPAIVAGSDGTVHLVWEAAAGHSADLYYRAQGQAGWLKIINLTNNSAGMGSWLPSAIMDGLSRLNLSWHDFRSGKPEIFHASVTNGLMANVLKASSGRGVSLNPSLFLGRDGVVGVVWVEASGAGKEVYFARAAQGGWGEASVAAGPFRDIQSPVAVQTSAGAISIFFAARTETGKALMVVSGDGTKWKEPAKLWEVDGPYALLKASADGKGAIHLLWSHGKPGKNSVYYSRTVL